jgi:hypothetical protein
MSVNDFIGSWSLIACEARSSDGEVRTPYGENPYGMLMYGGDGRLSVLIAKRDRPRFESNDLMRGTPDELKAAFEGFTGYCGTYEVDTEKGTVTHKLEGSWFPNWEDTDQVRNYRFFDNRLELTTEPRPARRASWSLALVWERLT